ncbi:nose resistant to fluoxetine protein 6-like [Ptychodera flava]|uniref:nose resistant to fluoxetine protein 6-like n=1 Tax=Ptychodera flava TaxID=63121 RepID=UPI00396A0FF8
MRLRQYIIVFVSIAHCCSILVVSEPHGGLVAPGNGVSVWDEVNKARALQNDDVLRKLVNSKSLTASDQPLRVADSPVTILPMNVMTSVNVSEKCANDTAKYLVDIVSEQMYALTMFDSVGKPPAGILEGNFQWIGSKKECLGVKGRDYANGTDFNGQYCQASFPLGTTFQYPDVALSYGLCVPDTCNDFEVLQMINLGLGLIPVAGLKASAVVCQEDQNELSTGAIVMIVVIGILLFLMAIGTLYDLAIPLINQNNGRFPIPFSLQHDVREDEETLTFRRMDSQKFHYHPGTLGQCLLAFSVLENGRKMLDTRQTAGTLAAIHGIRVLSMWWVILGHSYTSFLGIADNVLIVQDIMDRFTFQAILNATFSVDTFFFLSGLLVTYLTLRELTEGRKVNWVMFYIHRFWRLTPMYMFVIFFTTYFLPYLGSGPYQPLVHDLQEPCRKYWWTNLLYINNLVPWPADIEKQCFEVAWYLGNDMQFHVISPLLLLLLYKRPKIGNIVLSVLLAACLGIRAGLGVHHDLTSKPAYMNTPQDNYTYFVMSPYYYTKPWTRICTYLIGMFVGYLLVTMSLRFKINKVINFLCWVAAWVIALAVLYGSYGTLHGVVLSRGVDIFYMTVCRVAWGVAIGWLTFACLTGYGGPINTILAWKAWIPISRLTYAAYLSHPLVIQAYSDYAERLIHLTDLQQIYLYIGNLVLSYCVALVLSLMTEAPMMRLEKVLLRKDKKK